MRSARLPSSLLSSALLTGLFAFTAESILAAGAVDFEKDIRPLLQQRCVACHGPDKQKAGLRLDARAFALQGGSGGPVLLPAAGEKQGSLWLRLISTDDDERMPPPSEGPALSPAELEKMRLWLEAGAPWPETAEDRAALVDKRFSHWAFQPMSQPPVPEVVRAGRAVAHPVDAFLLDRLTRENLKPQPVADARTLIRRAHADLTGLPPAYAEVESFVAEHAHDPQAWPRLVDRLLASPAYGERWARHWLDIAHYADTHGFERDQLRPNAWRYRDYVVHAFNTDKPYARFLQEQIAGDVLAPNDPASVTATGFLAAGPWDFVGQVETKSDMLKRAARAGDLDDIVTQVLTSTMGLTVNCARCHDHKLDPIRQEEYYALWAVFAGVKRGDREIQPSEAQALAQEKAELQARMARLMSEEAKLAGQPLDLADMVGGGDGLGTGRRGAGIQHGTGRPATAKTGYVRDVVPDRLTRADFSASGARPRGDFVHGVFIPGAVRALRLAEGLELKGLPAGGGMSWDVVRNGPLNAQAYTLAAGVDYAGEGHSLLGLHANGGVVFDLAEIRRVHGVGELRFTATLAFGANPGARGSLADFAVYVDATPVLRHARLRKDETRLLEAALPSTARFLTLVATDGGDGISNDLLFLGDARLSTPARPEALSKEQAERLARLREELGAARQKLASFPEPARVYGVQPQSQAPQVRVQRRGNPEDEAAPVRPGGLACVKHLPPEFGGDDLPEGARRLALARWITHPENPLTARVLVNRLWHHHFGQGLVATPSDFGLGGSRPSHPELLDWLARDFLAHGGSLKHTHRLILTSAAYQRVSNPEEKASWDDAAKADAGNRLLWRQTARRLDAESLHDAVLAVSGCLNLQAGGPGWRDFDYTEAYAPIYRYITPDRPELWRRGIYRFVVRTTPHPFLTTLDCPDPANLTPARVTTTTALQALTLSNSAFMLQQARHLERRVWRETGGRETASAPAAVVAGSQIRHAFRLALQRDPSTGESSAALHLAQRHGLLALCRMLLNTNEFVYVD